jgi:ABC-type nitrate/sulfonate/bicarbonate transport system substrate-binding protein
MAVDAIWRSRSCIKKAETRDEDRVWQRRVLQINKMGVFLLSLLILTLNGKARAAEIGTARTSLIKVRAGMPYGTIVYGTYFLAKEMGFYRDEGLDLEIIHVTSVSGLQALLSEDLQFVGAGTTPINAALRGAKLKTVFVAVDKPEFDLYVNPKIRTFQDLKGKSLVVSGIGALTERLLKELLKLNGVDPADVIVRALGSAELRGQALAQGAVIPRRLLRGDQRKHYGD